MQHFFNKEGKPYIIAGPCSIESRDQVSRVTHLLGAMDNVDLIRCGIWKPRTMPGGFEGYGEEALRWIDEAKKGNASLRFCCEVANCDHVEAVMRNSIDAVWIGARTTGSPFAVQEITEALRGTDLPIMVKNAPMPDLHIWIGAIERCRKVGLKHIAAVHRGFDIYNNLGYRNNPLWEIPMELRRLMPELPLFCDPSHICGRREWIAQVAQTALDLHFDGLMVEVHPSPADALTDASQQIRPDELSEMLSRLVVRSSEADDSDVDLRTLRSHIDDVDRQVIALLADRQKATQKIAEIKQRENMTVFQPKRWSEVLADRIAQASELGLDPTYIKDLYEKIHAQSVKEQEKLLSGKE